MFRSQQARASCGKSTTPSSFSEIHSTESHPHCQSIFLQRRETSRRKRSPTSQKGTLSLDTNVSLLSFRPRDVRWVSLVPLTLCSVLVACDGGTLDPPLGAETGSGGQSIQGTGGREPGQPLEAAGGSLIDGGGSGGLSPIDGGGSGGLSPIDGGGGSGGSGMAAAGGSSSQEGSGGSTGNCEGSAGPNCPLPSLCVEGATRDGSTPCTSGFLVQECDDDAWHDTNECRMNAACLESETRTGTTNCGLNDNGYLQQSCTEGSWQNTAVCLDPDECTNGSAGVGATPCGLNGRGRLATLCQNGRWTDRPLECTDPDECRDQSIQQNGGTTTCGLNNRGTYVLVCQQGHWVESGTQCNDPDVCVNGTTRDSTTRCGVNGNGFLRARCTNGTWGDIAGSCVDPDACGATNQDCCAARTCNGGLGCNNADTCTNSCDLNFQLLRPGDVTVPGASIPSALVDSTQDYVWGRRVATLGQVGSTALHSIAERTDGIRGNAKDGFADIDELLMLSCPAYYDLLFPEEQAAVADLWNLLAAEVPATATPLAPRPVYDRSITDVSTRPSAITHAASELISSILGKWSTIHPDELRTAATRVQLAYNDDSNNLTISLTDLTNALNDPLGRFNVDEARLRAIHQELHARGVSNADARLRVPRPIDRDTAVVLGSFGQVQIHILTKVLFSETRLARRAGPPYQWLVYFGLSYEELPQISYPQNSFALLVPLNQRGELRFNNPNPASLKNLEAGDYILEHWQDRILQTHVRIRVSERLIEIPNTEVSLDEFINYRLEAFDGTNWVELTKNVRSGSLSNPNNVFALSFTHDIGVRSTNNGVPVGSTFLNAVADPYEDVWPLTKHKLPAGRYEIPTPHWGTVLLEIYPSNVHYVTIPTEGVRRRLRQSADGTVGDKEYRSPTEAAPHMVFSPVEDHEIHIYSPSFKTQLLPAMRTR